MISNSSNIWLQFFFDVTTFLDICFDLSIIAVKTILADNFSFNFMTLNEKNRYMCIYHTSTSLRVKQIFIVVS